VNAFWTYFWPVLSGGLIAGLFAGAFAFRPRGRRVLALAIGAAVSILLALLWHGPLGGADRFAAEVERNVRATIVYEQIPEVQGRLHHGPLTRRILLSGPADDFQREQLVEIIGEVPGVASATWSASGGIPLIVEAGAGAILGFLFGLLLAYLRELRRRYNAQWNW
jgi:hypothetical protein